MTTHLLLPALAAALLTTACQSPPASTPRVGTPTSTTAPNTPEVIEWFLGEQVRGTTPSNRKSNMAVVGILTVNPKAKGDAHSTPRPNSCKEGLIQFIPTPTRGGVWFGLDEQGELLLYAGDGWALVPAKAGVEVPRIRRLLALAGPASRFELLVTVPKDNREYLSVLVLEEEQVVDVQAPAPLAFADRENALMRFNSGRCVDGVHDCLHLTAVGDELILMREPELYGNRQEVETFAKDGTHDVRYADVTGTKVDVLTTHACVPAGEPSAEPEAAQ